MSEIIQFDLEVALNLAMKPFNKSDLEWAPCHK